MSENTSILSGPKKLWNGAMKAVKGEDSVQLMESFTAEMTLVAEGLCEDQNKLRGEVNSLMNEEDRRLQRQESRIQELEVSLAEQQRENDQVVTELRNRLAALEKHAENRRREGREKKTERNRIRETTILIAVAAIAAIAVILVWKLV